MLIKTTYAHLGASAYGTGLQQFQTSQKRPLETLKQTLPRMKQSLARMIFPFSTSAYNLAQTTDKCNSLGDASLISQMVITATPNRGQHTANTAAKQLTGSRLVINV